MTAPISLPTPSLGNLATDISGAAAGFVQGLQKEKERRRQAALEQALLQVKAMQASQPDRPFRIEVPGAQPGTFEQGLLSTTGQLTRTGVPAAVPQFFTVTQDEHGNLKLVASPRETFSGASGQPAVPGAATQPQPPGPVAQQVELPSGQQPRDVRPSPFAVETPEGPRLVGVDPRKGIARPIVGPGGEQVIPRAQEGEIVRAQAGVAMQLASGTMDEIEQRALRGDQAAFRAIDEVVNRLALQRATFRIPLAGEGLAGSVQAAEQLGLSEEGARYLASFAALISNAVPARAGKQMTINEMLLIMREFVPGLGELDKPQAWAQKIRNRKILVNTTLEAAGAGIERFRDLEVPPPSAPTPKVINPRFDPRRNP